MCEATLTDELDPFHAWFDILNKRVSCEVYQASRGAATVSIEDVITNTLV